jgi:glycosyltransferase involved in cell wall biosynthesis
MRVINGLMFFPRGGSSQVVQALADELPRHGWDTTIVSGSVPGGFGDATVFYAGEDVRPVVFGVDAPMHPSYEDRPGAADVCFATVDDAAYERHVAAWADALEHAGAADADVLQLHHLTPLNEAAARVAPGVPVVGHLHGTELLMLEEIARGAPAHWTHAHAWERRMRRWARACTRLIVLTPGHVARAADVLGVDPAVCVVVPNGFDPAQFRPAEVDRTAVWRHHLVDEPHGWRPGEEPGTIAYADADLGDLDDAVVLVAVGRYTAVKRLPLLIDAFARARARTRRRAVLMVVGGHPGEWEGEHPIDAVERGPVPDVFLTGWQAHAQLPQLFSASDVQVLASAREQFGLVLVEGMACGLPAIAVDRLGPGDIVHAGETGWLVEPEDDEGLVDALVAAVDDGEERARRGIAAHRDAKARWAWPALADRVAAVLEEAALSRPGTPTPA